MSYRLVARRTHFRDEPPPDPTLRPITTLLPHYFPTFARNAKSWHVARPARSSRKIICSPTVWVRARARVSGRGRGRGRVRVRVRES